MEFIFLVVGIIFFRIIWNVVKEKVEEEERENEIILRKKIEDHFSTLKIKFSQAQYTDDYGTEIISNSWQKEIEYFVENIVFPGKKLSPPELFLLKMQAINIFREIMINSDSNNAVTACIKTGLDYEFCIENILKNNGFPVQRTPKTGDQGVDLLTKVNSKTIGIQCKFYSHPVGNKAVQEISSGKGYYQCDYGIVVSNQRYTLSARKLAHNLGIELLSEENVIEYLKKHEM